MEMEPKISAEASISATEESDMSTNGTTTTITSASVDKNNGENNLIKREKNQSVSASTSNLSHGSGLIQGEEAVVKTDEASAIDPCSKEADRDRKSSAHSKNPPAKKKSKVDWTLELHRKFVQAVEQLGVDKAVPSRILEIMGIDCLTRHNVASHLQKYRSHRKHTLSREAGEVSWNVRRQGCGTMNRPGKRDANSWVVPSMGFPPTTPMPHYGPLHVWGHPSADQSLMYMWPLPTSTPAYNPPPGDPYWYYNPHDVPATGMPCFSPHFAPTRFPTAPVPGISPSSVYRIDPGFGIPTVPTAQTPLQAPFDFQPSKENIDAVIGDVLSKPWLPLPLGLKPPSIDSVVVELQRQGISKIPPNCA